MLPRWRLSIGALGALALACAAATASELGTPMDCSDLVLPAGLSCSQLAPPGTGVGGFREGASVIDNEGVILQTGQGGVEDIIETLGRCGTRDLAHITLIYEGDGVAQDPFISARLRCLDATTSAIEFIRSGNILFDAVAGRLIVGLNSSCFPSSSPACANYGGGSWIAHIDGFPSIADLLPAPPPPRCHKRTPRHHRARRDDSHGRSPGDDVDRRH